MKLLSVIVTYYPDPAVLLRGINSFIEEIDSLIIWDNTPIQSCLADDENFEFLKNGKIQVLGTGENKGIGYALNQGIKYALENNFDYLLTMDQDSYFDNRTFTHLKRAAVSLNKSLIAGFAPYVCIKNLTDKPTTLPGNNFSETHNPITSGTLYKVSLFQETAFFRDDFFIDAIDTEYNLRVKRAGCCFFIEPKAWLLHELGNIEMRKMIFRRIRCFNYSPMRCYYFARNHYLVCCEYPSIKRWFGYWKSFIFRNFSVVLFESEKCKKVAAYFRGFWDGMRRRTGICDHYQA